MVAGIGDGAQAKKSPLGKKTCLKVVRGVRSEKIKNKQTNK